MQHFFAILLAFIDLQDFTTYILLETYIKSMQETLLHILLLFITFFCQDWPNNEKVKTKISISIIIKNE